MKHDKIKLPPPLYPEDETKPPKSKPKANKHKGRFAEINAFTAASQRELSRSQIAVWLVLWTKTDAKTGLAKVSLTAMANEAGCSRRAAIDAIKDLEQKRLVKQVSRGSNLTNEPSVYKTYSTSKV